MEQRKLAAYILSYLEAHLHEPLTLDELSDAVHYSKFYLNRVFQKSTGKTIGAYLRERRLNQAAQELVETKQPIIQIAMNAGYKSQQAFTGAFRRVYQCTPQVYRRRGVFVPLYPVCVKCTFWGGFRWEGRAA